MQTILSSLVGVNFRPAEAREIVKHLNIGEALYLEVEPENPYDSNAVKVLNDDGVFLGYLSRESNAETAEHLASGGTYSCEVISFLSAIKPHLEIILFDEDEDEE